MNWNREWRHAYISIRRGFWWISLFWPWIAVEIHPGGFLLKYGGTVTDDYGYGTWTHVVGFHRSITGWRRISHHYRRRKTANGKES